MPAHTRRLRIDVHPAVMHRFARLLELGRLRTDRELLDTAVTMLEWAVNQWVAGRIVGSVDEATGTFRELSTPYLEAFQPTTGAPPGSRGPRPIDPAAIHMSTIAL